MAGLSGDTSLHVRSRRQNTFREPTIAPGDERSTPSQLPPLLVWPTVVRISAKHGRRSARLAHSRAYQLAPAARAHRFDIRGADDRIDVVRWGDCRPRRSPT